MVQNKNDGEAGESLSGLREAPPKEVRRSAGRAGHRYSRRPVPGRFGGLKLGLFGSQRRDQVRQARPANQARIGAAEAAIIAAMPSSVSMVPSTLPPTEVESPP